MQFVEAYREVGYQGRSAAAGLERRILQEFGGRVDVVGSLEGACSDFLIARAGTKR